MVIATIAILAALLQPALSSARATAVSVVCKNYERNQFTILCVYGDSYDGYWPWITTPFANAMTTWVNALNNNQKEIITCPAIAPPLGWWWHYYVGNDRVFQAGYVDGSRPPQLVTRSAPDTWVGACSGYDWWAAPGYGIGFVHGTPNRVVYPRPLPRLRADWPLGNTTNLYYADGHVAALKNEPPLAHFTTKAD